jgi:hypothetical protein
VKNCEPKAPPLTRARSGSPVARALDVTPSLDDDDDDVRVDDEREDDDVRERGCGVGEIPRGRCAGARADARGDRECVTDATTRADEAGDREEGVWTAPMATREARCETRWGKWRVTVDAKSIDRVIVATGKDARGRDTARG